MLLFFDSHHPQKTRHCQQRRFIRLERHFFHRILFPLEKHFFFRSKNGQTALLGGALGGKLRRGPTDRLPPPPPLDFLGTLPLPRKERGGGEKKEGIVAVAGIVAEGGCGGGEKDSRNRQNLLYIFGWIYSNIAHITVNVYENQCADFLSA